MSNKQNLREFVQDALVAGRSRLDIETALNTAGWSPSEIAEALSAWSESEFVPPVPRPQAVVTARDFFVYALMFGTLIFGASYLVWLIIYLVEWMLHGAFTSWQRDSVRLAMAILFVTAPVYAWLTLRERKKLASDPSLYRSTIRKWMIYLALLIAATVLLSDLVFAIYSLLEGDFTLQFLLNVLAVSVVAGGIFLFYLADIRRSEQL
jgi:Domain of unknown function (DUF5671)